MAAQTRYFPISTIFVRDDAGWLGRAIEADISVRHPLFATALDAMLDAVSRAVCGHTAAETHPRPPANADALWDLFFDVIDHGAPVDDPEACDRIGVPALFTVEPDGSCSPLLGTAMGRKRRS